MGLENADWKVCFNTCNTNLARERHHQRQWHQTVGGCDEK
jgi:hypothetical protein